MAAIPARDRRLLFVTGKGGVGKTTVAGAIARLAADGGKRVLLCSVDDRHDLAEAFSLRELTFKPTPVDDRLSVMVMDTEASLREYLRIYLKLPMVGRIGPVAAAFDFVATAAPGVREILTIGKVCYEVREAHYDLVVVDAPSTGHVVGYLAAPQAIQRLVRVGLIRNQSDWMLRILSDRAMTGVVVVTTPEEMPVAETLELVGSINRETTVDLAAVIVNRVPPELFLPRDAALVESVAARRAGPFGDRGLNGLFDAARVAIDRRRVATSHLEVLRSGLGSRVPLVIQPFLFDVASPSRVVTRVAASLDEELS